LLKRHPTGEGGVEAPPLELPDLIERCRHRRHLVVSKRHDRISQSIPDTDASIPGIQRPTDVSAMRRTGDYSST
jgi:hypothetical protein